jgi:hypothetical protein
MISSRFLLALLFASVIGIASCKRDNPFWDTGIVAPILKASLTIDDILPDSLLETGSNGEITVVYETKFIGLSDTLFNIPDTTIDTAFHIPFFSLFLQPGGLITPNNSYQQTKYSLNGVEIVAGKLRSGTMYLLLRNDVMRRISFRYEIPSATFNGVPFDTTIIIPAAVNNTTPSYISATIDLAGYDLDMTGLQNNISNTLVVRYEARIDPTESSGITIIPADTVGIASSFTGVIPEFIRGYFGSSTIAIGPETTNFNLFQRIQSGSIGLEALNMELVLENYVGMDARVTLNDIWSTNSQTGNTVHLNAPMMDQPINVDRASYSFGFPPSVPWTQTYTLNNSNSNARALVENLPDQLGYDVTLVTNPLGNVSGNNDFFFMDWAFNGKLRVELPLSFFASNITLSDTIDYDFTTVENKEDILKGTLTMTAENGFPFDAQIQLYLMDVNGTIIDSLIAMPNNILSAPTTTSGSHIIANGQTTSQLLIPLNEQQTQNLFFYNRIMIKTRFNTTGAPSYVQIYNTNKIDFRLTADFDYRVNN